MMVRSSCCVEIRKRRGRSCFGTTVPSVIAGMDMMEPDLP